MLQYIIPSKTRRKILGLFLKDVSRTYHLRRVSREVDEEINAVKRELDILEKAKVLKKERRLNKAMYTLNTRYIFFDEFLRIFFKETSLVKALHTNLVKLGKVHLITVSKKFLLREKISTQEVYFLFVGTIVTAELARIFKEEQKNFPNEINYTVMTKDEFAYRKKNNDPFIWAFLKQPQVVLIGTEEELYI